MKKNNAAFKRLVKIIAELREKCPWDQKQTFESLRALTIEETYELADAILENNVQEIKKELGDLIMHVVFYSQIAKDNKQFEIADVLNGICDKLIYRHPHVYSDVKVEDSDEVMQNWEQLKLKEEGGNTSVLDGVPKSLPSLVKAHRIQSKARGMGFDWEKKEQVWEKVQEEIGELQREIEQNNVDNIEKEFGDVFFALINAARLYNVNSENALEKTNIEFIRRFNYLEKKAREAGKELSKMKLEEMEVLWEEAKKDKKR